MGSTSRLVQASLAGVGVGMMTVEVGMAGIGLGVAGIASGAQAPRVRVMMKIKCNKGFGMCLLDRLLQVFKGGHP